MSLVEQINNDLKEAMKAKEKDKLMALRAIKSALLMAQTAGSASDVGDAAGIKILQKQLKQRKDAAAMYKDQDREDLYEVEMKEASFIEAYLPEMMSVDEITVAVKTIIEKTGATSMKEMGKVMGMASKELTGKAEGKVISEVVKQLLA